MEPIFSRGLGLIGSLPYCSIPLALIAKHPNVDGKNFIYGQIFGAATWISYHTIYSFLYYEFSN